jgi:hypothetical protein
MILAVFFARQWKERFGVDFQCCLPMLIWNRLYFIETRMLTWLRCSILETTSQFNLVYFVIELTCFKEEYIESNAYAFEETNRKVCPLLQRIWRRVLILAIETQKISYTVKLKWTKRLTAEVAVATSGNDSWMIECTAGPLPFLEPNDDSSITFRMNELFIQF